MLLLLQRVLLQQLLQQQQQCPRASRGPQRRCQGGPSVSILFFLCCILLLAAAPQGAPLLLPRGSPPTHLGGPLLGPQSRVLPSFAAQQQQQQQQQQRGLLPLAFAEPLGALRNLLRSKKKVGGDPGAPKAECSSKTASSSGSSSSSSSDSSSSNSSTPAKASNPVEAAIGSALALAAEQMGRLRQQLNAVLLQQLQQLQQQQPLQQQQEGLMAAEAPGKKNRHQTLPITELAAAAVATAAKKRLRDIVKGPAAAAAAAADEGVLQRAEGELEAYVDSEAKGLFQQQMQQQILLLLQPFASGAAAAAADSPEGSRSSKGADPEQQLAAAAAAATQEFGRLLQQCVPSAQVRERWGCRELQQLLQQQLLQHLKGLRLQRSEQQQQAETLLRVVQHQQGLLQQLQQQLQQEQQPRPFSMGAAYRVPDTNLQVAAAARHGKLQLNFTCVPDDSPAAAAGVLGQQGFVRGVEGLGNLGLSCSFSI
ncbi:hypothetical protein, conserved [Eimeria tenella]|uniref:Uncharacterized protein n=1 Tax=Eimeria tenella TaxID=5802 RepID=U6L5J9_EIMTE|nr:hypothetical protein, conserved [Eimeria tenella]CDJ45411.1 hypothetical protein, conserved [Eimeria tenella]|eukprot:XP_013236157.1 hypothetical protein, conserved [Eimeria tenella]